MKIIFWKHFKAASFSLALILGFGGTATAESFDAHVRGIAAKLVRAGVNPARVNRAFATIVPDVSVSKSNKNQPESRSSVASYIVTRVSERRTSLGLQALAPHRGFLEKLRQRYGVDPYIVASIWGLESSYGSILGNRKLIKPVINSMVNLSYRSKRRRGFAYKQILTLFKFESAGGKKAEDYLGSWAGAIGHTQFIPTTMHAYAVDGDGNADIDLEVSVEDSLASTANFLAAHRWRAASPWGAPVVLPKKFNYQLAGARKYRPASFFAKKGIKLMSGKPVKSLGKELSLYLPSGASGPAFLLTRNFNVIRRYNRSDSYALSVGLLADRLRGRKDKLNWGIKDDGLTLSEAKKLQKVLTRLGHYDGKVDGLIGEGTKTALASYQRSIGVKADGHPTRKLIKTLGITSGVK